MIFMSVWGWGRLDLALLHPSDCHGSLLSSASFEKDRLFHLTPGKH